MSSMSSGLLCLLVSYVCYVLCLLCLLVSYVFSSPMSHFTLAHTHTSVLHAAGAWRGTLVRHLCRARHALWQGTCQVHRGSLAGALSLVPYPSPQGSVLDTDTVCRALMLHRALLRTRAAYSFAHSAPVLHTALLCRCMRGFARARCWSFAHAPPCTPTHASVPASIPPRPQARRAQTKYVDAYLGLYPSACKPPRPHTRIHTSHAAGIKEHKQHTKMQMQQSTNNIHRCSRARTTYIDAAEHKQHT